MNALPRQKRVQILSCLVDGNSIRATARIVGVSKWAVLRLLERVGERSLSLHNKLITNVQCTNIQCDEIWCFCYAKSKNLPPSKAGKRGVGDVWVWTALDAESKLLVSWVVGHRDVESARVLMRDLANRLAAKERVHITTDGLGAYPDAVRKAFGKGVDYSMVVKLFGYNNPHFVGVTKRAIIGYPQEEKISTSYVERNNLTIRMGLRRLTRNTNAFSKKLVNLRYALGLHFAYYNFCRVHQSLRITPAMSAKVTDRLWSLDDLLNLATK